MPLMSYSCYGYDPKQWLNDTNYCIASNFRGVKISLFPWTVNYNAHTLLNCITSTFYTTQAFNLLS